MNIFTGLLSAVNPYGTILKLAVVAILIGLLMWCGSTLSTWHSASQELPVIKAQLAAEIACLKNSQCEVRALRQAEEAKQTIAQAQKDYNDRAAVDRTNQQKASEQKAQEDANKVKAAQQSLTKLQQQIELKRHSNASCEATFHSVDPCL